MIAYVELLNGTRLEVEPEYEGVGEDGTARLVARFPGVGLAEVDHGGIDVLPGLTELHFEFSDGPA